MFKPLIVILLISGFIAACGQPSGSPETAGGGDAARVAAGASDAAATAESSEAAAARSVPAANLDFVLRDMNGGEVRLSDFAGNVILLDFWATWCAPCRIEIPGFIELLDQYGDQGFVMLGISVDDTPEAMQSFAEELQIDYPLLVGLDRDDVKDAYGPLVGFPTSFIIDRNGNIRETHTGFAPKSRFEQDILSVL